MMRFNKMILNGCATPENISKLAQLTGCSEKEMLNAVLKEKERMIEVRNRKLDRMTREMEQIKREAIILDNFGDVARIVRHAYDNGYNSDPPSLIAAIKQYREIYPGVNLTEAKRIVQDML